VAEVRNDHHSLRTLDFGCGSGNLTGDLLALRVDVTAADVSTGFLDLVKARFKGEPPKIHQLNGSDLSEFPDQSFDLVASYSVLHHIPDYSAAVPRWSVCSKGAVIVIDHDASPNAWQPDSELERFRREATLVEWRKYARPANYLHRIRRMFDPKYSNEGDVHVWPDDHIEWGAIEEVMRDNGCEVVLRQDYLLSRRNYRPEVFERYRDRCKDTRVTIFRRNSR